EGSAWKSTRDTAAAVLALLETTSAAREEGGDTAIVRLRVGGGLVMGVSLSREDLLSEGATIDVPSQLLRSGRNQVSLVKAGGLDVHYAARLDYLVPGESFEPESHGFEVSRETARLTRDGEGLRAGELGENVARGDLLLVTVTVTSSRDRRFVVVDCPIPAGTEAIPAEGLLEELSLDQIWVTHLERHDDRVLAFLPVLPEEARVMFVLRVTHSGRFRTLPARASLMYFPRVRGSSAGEILYVE
ncbi:MAG: alpha-2-macroglobulin family protein, partial [Planctomycetota bacterium]